MEHSRLLKNLVLWMSIIAIIFLLFVLWQIVQIIVDNIAYLDFYKMSQGPHGTETIEYRKQLICNILSCIGICFAIATLSIIDVYLWRHHQPLTADELKEKKLQKLQEKIDKLQ